MKTSTNSTWIIICVPGSSSTMRENADHEINKRLVRFKSLFPYFENYGSFYLFTTVLQSTFYIGGPEILKMKYF